MTSRIMMMLALGVAGCTDRATPATNVPGADPDTVVVSRALAHATEDARPCGYQRTENFPPSPGISGNINRFSGKLSYDSRGQLVLDAAVDEHGDFGHNQTYDYDVMGNLTHYVDAYPDNFVTEGLLVYDGFGRLTRYEIDRDGGPVTVATYGYGTDGNRISAHRVTPDRVDDRSYTYDSDGRLIEVTQDNGPDGTVDLTSRYVYDDVQRTVAMTMTDPAGLVVETDTTHYDADNHAVREEYFSIRNKAMAQIFVDYANTYADGRLTISTEVTREPDPVNGDYTYDTRDEWHYGSCN